MSDTPGPRRFHCHVDPAAWQAVDWTRHNADIARSLNVHRSAVTLARRTYAPGTAADTPARRFAVFVRTRRDELHGLTAAEIVRRSGCAVDAGHARQMVKAAGVRTGRRPSKWAGLDWRLPVTDLARIGGLRVQQVSDLRRRLGAQRARWRLNPNGPLVDPEYLAALEAERARAAGTPARYHPRP